MSTATTASTARASRLPSITTDQLARMLAERRGATFATITALTTPEGRKTPMGPLKKLCRINATVGAYYDRALAKATGREARDERAWGEHAESCLVRKVGADGRETFYLPTQNPRYGKPLYLVQEGAKLRMVPTDVAKGYLRQRPEVPVVYRDFRLDHIVAIAIGGRRYRVRREA